MFYYRLYVLNKSSRIDGAHELHCGNDEEACERANLICGEQSELWRGSRRIDCPKDIPKDIKPHPAELPDFSPQLLRTDDD